MVKFSIAFNSYLVRLVVIRYIDVSRSFGKIIGESIGNTFQKKFIRGNTFLMKYRYW